MLYDRQAIPSTGKIKPYHVWNLACFPCRESARSCGSFKQCILCDQEMTCIKYRLKNGFPKKHDAEGWQILEFNHQEYLKRLEIRKLKQMMKILMR